MVLNLGCVLSSHILLRVSHIIFSRKQEEEGEHTRSSNQVQFLTPLLRVHVRVKFADNSLSIKIGRRHELPRAPIDFSEMRLRFRNSEDENLFIRLPANKSLSLVFEDYGENLETDGTSRENKSLNPEHLTIGIPQTNPRLCLREAPKRSTTCP